MSFKIGDRVRQTARSAQTCINLVEHWREHWQDRVCKTDGTFFITGYHPTNSQYILYSAKPNGGGPMGGWFVDQFELVESAPTTSEAPTTNPFLKTVTEMKLVDAQTIIGGNFIEVGPNADGTISLYVENSSYRKEDIAELARILSEIAEAM